MLQLVWYLYVNIHFLRCKLTCPQKLLSWQYFVGCTCADLILHTQDCMGRFADMPDYTLNCAPCNVSVFRDLYRSNSCNVHCCKRGWVWGRGRAGSRNLSEGPAKRHCQNWRKECWVLARKIQWEQLAERWHTGHSDVWSVKPKCMTIVGGKGPNFQGYSMHASQGLGTSDCSQSEPGHIWIHSKTLKLYQNHELNVFGVLCRNCSMCSGMLNLYAQD